MAERNKEGQEGRREEGGERGGRRYRKGGERREELSSFITLVVSHSDFHHHEFPCIHTNLTSWEWTFEMKKTKQSVTPLIII